MKERSTFDATQAVLKHKVSIFLTSSIYRSWGRDRLRAVSRFDFLITSAGTCMVKASGPGLNNILNCSH